MALIKRSRRALPSEFTFHYYDQGKGIEQSVSSLKEKDIPPAPPVPPLLPKNTGSCWSAPPPVNPAIWRASHQVKVHQAKSASSFSQRQREENKRLCEEVRCLTATNYATVKHRLEDRLSDITFWHEELQRRHLELSDKLNYLKVLHKRLQTQYEKFLYPLEVTQKCIELRELRIGVENVEDEVSTALRSESQDIDTALSTLKRTLEDCKEQIRSLLSCLYHLDNNIRQKQIAITTDKRASQLTALERPCGNVIPNQKINPSSVSVKDWRESSLSLVKCAEKENELSLQISSTGEAVLTASARQVREAKDHTDEALKKKIEDTRNAKSILEEEHSKIVEEEGKLKASIAEVEAELEAKKEFLIVAQTRLETRKGRPQTEQTRDEVEASLIKEIEELEMTSGRLLKALKFSQRQLQSVTSSKILLEHDINLKSKTIHIDEVQVLGLRSTVVIDQC